MTGRRSAPPIGGAGDPAPSAEHEPSRARYPDSDGYAERDGVRLFYEVYGKGEPTVLLLPPWSIVHSRVWKAQIPYLARHFRVVAFDPRGNGKSGRPADPRLYAIRELAADALAILDETATERAVLVSLSLGAQPALVLAAEHAERVLSSIFIAPSVTLTTGVPGPPELDFTTARSSYEGFEKVNMHYWLAEYRAFLEFFFAECLPEPHSTKQREDGVRWGLDTTAQTLIATVVPGVPGEAETRKLCGEVGCPVWVIHGDEDHIVPHAVGAELAAAAGGELVTLSGSGHLAPMRDPVLVNRLLRDLIDPSRSQTPGWRRARERRKRALYVSSPIGLGHARRDVAIADELRGLRPGLEVEWLAQHPVTAVLQERGERIHPASAGLANESAHMRSESVGHELNCFEAWRRMDEILVANFMVFDEVAREGRYDLWVGDEAWEVDYFLHENPELKSAAYAWLTDFVGWLPMPAGGEREASLTADYNAEMVEQIARYPRVRDRAIFIGKPDDIVPGTFGPGLPEIRGWTERHFSFAGYVTGFDPVTLGDRERLRAELGYGPDDCVCVVSVGGSGIGEDLLRRVIAAFSATKQLVPALRMVAVAGPRIDPARLPTAPEIDVLPYVHDLYRHLAACDVAVVQGGLATTMELTASRRPFIYVPLERHFEQNLHVARRLDRYRAGRRMHLEETTPDALATAIAQELSRELEYLPVAADGAAHAAAMIAELL